MTLSVRALVPDFVGWWRDPRVRHQRRLQQLRRRWERRLVLAAGLAGVTAVSVPYHGLGLLDLGWGGLTAAAAAGAALARRDFTAHQRLPVPAPPPPAGSVTRPVLHRLDNARTALATLLAQLGTAAGDAGQEAAAGEAALRDHAARVGAVERALAVAPAETRPVLTEARAALLVPLETGVAAYERLVAAAADAVGAAATGAAGTTAVARLTEAADTLAGLAAGLRDLNGKPE
ncbi:MAG: phage shock envelope stress response protein PspM [Mycobacteriales bacterium]